MLEGRCNEQGLRFGGGALMVVAAWAASDSIFFSAFSSDLATEHSTAISHRMTTSWNYERGISST